jgi:hypothetical protein
MVVLFSAAIMLAYLVTIQIDNYAGYNVFIKSKELNNEIVKIQKTEGGEADQIEKNITGSSTTISQRFTIFTAVMFSVAIGMFCLVLLSMRNHQDYKNRNKF